MTRTQIPELIIGCASGWVSQYLFPTTFSILQWTSTNTEDPALKLAAANTMFTILICLMIAVYCWGSVLETVVIFFYNICKEHNRTKRRDYL